MPERVVEPVVHFTVERGMWIEPRERLVPTYEEKVAARMDELRSAHPDGRYPSAHAEHEDGECVECDALRALDR